MIKMAKWVLIRNGEVRNVFKDRKKAVAYFKELLSQTFKDFEGQDTSNEYTYPIVIPETKIIPIEEREAYLSLI